MQIDNNPGAAADVVELFSRAGIGLTYIYTFLLRNKGILVFRTDKPELTAKTIEDNHLPTISEEELTV